MKGSFSKIIFIFIGIIFCTIFTIYRQNLFFERKTETKTSKKFVVSKVPKFYKNQTLSPPKKLLFHEKCQGEERHLCVPPFEAFDKRFRGDYGNIEYSNNATQFQTAAKYKLNVCVIEKNLSTILTAILCFLFNEEKFISSNRNINDEDFHHRFCGQRNEATNINSLEKKFNIELAQWTHVVAVREPIERFISGFTDKCLVEKVWIKRPSLCNRCKTNVTCFIEKEYIRMFKYLKGEEINSFDDRHFFPQSWRCQFYQYFRRFKVLQYSNKETDKFFQQFFEILRSSGVPEASIDFIDKQLHEAKTNHTTDGRKERQKLEKEIRTNPRILERLTQMYYYDFLLFGFSLPQINK